MSTEGPKPYPVVYDPDSGLQYSFATGYVNIVGSATPPAGADTQIQFNNGGVFGASADLTFAYDTLLLSGTTPTLALKSGRPEAFLYIDTTTGVFHIDHVGLANAGHAAFSIDAYANLINFSMSLIGTSGTRVRVPLDIYAGSISGNASAILGADSTTQGFLPPRMTSTQRDAVSTPATGLEIYNTTSNQPEVYNGSSWVAMGGGSSSETTSYTASVGSPYTPSAVNTSVYVITVDANLTVNGPSNPYSGQKVLFQLKNDASHAVTFATGSGNFRFGTTVTGYTGTASKTDYVGAVWNSGSGVWDIVSESLGF
jgi:hypothetical protein